MRRPASHGRAASTTDILFHALKDYAAEHYAGMVKCVRVVYELTNGDEVRIPLGTCSCCQIGDRPEDYLHIRPQAQATPNETAEADGEDLSEAEGAILEALASGPLASKQLAPAAGLRHNSHYFRELAALKGKGLVEKQADGLYHSTA